MKTASASYRSRSAAILAAVVVSAACGSITSTTTNPDEGLLDPAQPRSATPDISVTAAGLVPIVLHVDYPVTVTFTNNDTIPHKFESAPELGWDNCPELNTLATLKPGAKVSLPFTEREAVCAYHDVAKPKDVPFQGYVVIH